MLILGAEAPTLVGIYELRDPNGRDLAVQSAYERILKYNGIRSIRLRVEQPEFWEQVQHLSLFIMRFQHADTNMQQARDILPVVERDYGTRCFPNQNTAWHYDDKIKQFFHLNAYGFPFTKSWIFYDRMTALEWVKHTDLPIVFKLRGGAGSTNVVLVKTRRQAKLLIDTMFSSGIHPERMISPDALRFQHFNLFQALHRMAGNVYRRSHGLDMSPYWQVQKNYVLFQRFLPGNDCDTRITVIGDRAFGFRRLVRKNDFRASGSGQIDYDFRKIDPRCVEIAFEVSQRMGFQSMAYDFLRNENGQPEFCEVSFNYVSRAVYLCPGYWDASHNWHAGNWWPEHLHLIDALDDPSLRVPDLRY